jgi:hypothetical protein
MNVFNSIQLSKIPKKKINNNIYTNNGSQLTGWTTSGTCSINGSTGNPTPSIFVSSSSNCYINIPGITTFKNHTIQFDINTTPGSLINVYFACNSAGLGQMFRLETRASNFSGFTSTTNWTTWTAPSSGPTLTGNTWYTVRITITSAGVATYTYNGSTTSAVSYNIADNGTYIGIVGDGIAGGYVDNIIIT